MPARPSRREDYRLFPRHYFELLSRFKLEKEVRIGGFEQKAATSLRRDLYRFFGYIRNAVPSGDPVASDLADLIDIITITINEHEGRFWVVLGRNPIVDAMGDVTRQEAMSHLMAALSQKA